MKNLNLIKGQGMTMEELCEKFGTEVCEEELRNVKYFRDILEYYEHEYVTSEKRYWTEKEEQIFDREPRRWNSDQLRLMLLEVSDKYLDMPDEELADITPFDVLNDINNLI